MPGGYEFIEGITSDVKVIVWGDSFEELLVYAAKAMFAVMYDSKPVENWVDVEIEGYNEEDVLVQWLSLLLAEHEIRQMGFFEFQVKVERYNEKYVIRGKAGGARITEEDIQTLVKGVTYHDLRVWKENNSYKAVLTFDI